MRTTQYNRMQYNAMHKFVRILDKYAPKRYQVNANI